jgi:hypothetical protein
MLFKPRLQTAPKDLRLKESLGDRSPLHHTIL